MKNSDGSTFHGRLRSVCVLPQADSSFFARRANSCDDSVTYKRTRRSERCIWLRVFYVDSRADSPDIDLSSPRSFMAKSRSTSVVIFGAKLLVNYLRIYGRLQRYILSHRDGGRLTAACDGGGCPGGGGAGRAERRKIRELLAARAAGEPRRHRRRHRRHRRRSRGPRRRDTPAPAPLGALLKSGSNKSINLFFIVAAASRRKRGRVRRHPSSSLPQRTTPTPTPTPPTHHLAPNPSSPPPHPPPRPRRRRCVRAPTYTPPRVPPPCALSTLPDVDFDLARASIAALDSPSAFPSSPSRVGLARTATRTFRRARSTRSPSRRVASSSSSSSRPRARANE